MLLLTVVAVALAVWAAGEIAERQERDAVDTQLAASLRLAREDFADALEEARGRAESLAGTPSVQRALAERDRRAAARIASRQADVALYAGDELLGGAEEGPVQRAVAVTGGDGQTLGTVVVSVPLEDELARRLAESAGLEGDGFVAIADENAIVASSGSTGALPSSDRGEAELAGDEFRYVSSPLLEGAPLRLAALSTREPIAESVRDTRLRALLAALATIALIALLAWTLSRLLARREPAAPPQTEAEGDRRRGPPRGGRRVRDAVALVGEALAATHDPEALLPVILQSAIEATGAAGARIVSGGSEVARAGDPGSGGRPLTLPLGTEEEAVGRLLLYPPARGAFDRDAEQLASWLAAQASIALENERLHRTVKRQAITDELTQLANRRRFTETLALEVRRAERFGDPLTLVLADLDDFKQINDRFGHQVGDEVLRRFADVLRENVRDFDLPVRFGGEEFAVLLPETGQEGGEQLARRLAAALALLRIPELGVDRQPVTASFGVASYPAARSAEEILTAADRALYRAKAEGKNRVVSGVSDAGRGD